MTLSRDELTAMLKTNENADVALITVDDVFAELQAACTALCVGAD